jgi:hypothetical protein
MALMAQVQWDSNQILEQQTLMTQKNSPMWRISFMEWKDPSQARVLENLNDINMMLQKGLITLMPAMEGRHIVNCPFFDAETITEHQKGSS